MCRTRARRCALARFSTPTRERLAEAFWPGPLTLVLPKADGCPVSELATAGLDSIAVRVPDHPVARDLLEAFGKPVVAPSANRSGHVSPTTAAACARRSRRPHRPDPRRRRRPASASSPPSSSCLGAPTLLRPGGLPREAIERVLGHALARRRSRRRTTRRSRPACSPRTTRRRRALRLEARDVRAGRSAARRSARTLPRRRRAMLNLSPARRPRRSRRQPVLASARARCRRRARHRRDADPERGPRRGDQRPACARGRAATAEAVTR